MSVHRYINSITVSLYCCERADLGPDFSIYIIYLDLSGAAYRNVLLNFKYA